MSTTKHTAEPWYVLRDTDKRTGITVHGGKRFDEACPESPVVLKAVAAVSAYPYGRYEIAEANAVRAAECVNKLAGHDDLSQVRLLDRDTFDLLMFDLQQLEGILQVRAQQAEMGFMGLKSLAALRALGG